MAGVFDWDAKIREVFDTWGAKWGVGKHTKLEGATHDENTHGCTALQPCTDALFKAIYFYIESHNGGPLDVDDDDLFDRRTAWETMNKLAGMKSNMADFHEITGVSLRQSPGFKKMLPLVRERRLDQQLRELSEFIDNHVQSQGDQFKYLGFFRSVIEVVATFYSDDSDEAVLRAIDSAVEDGSHCIQFNGYDDSDESESDNGSVFSATYDPEEDTLQSGNTFYSMTNDD